MKQKMTILTGHTSPKPSDFDSLDLEGRSATGWCDTIESLSFAGFWNEKSLRKRAIKNGIIFSVSYRHVELWDFRVVGEKRIELGDLQGNSLDRIKDAV